MRIAVISRTLVVILSCTVVLIAASIPRGTASVDHVEVAGKHFTAEFAETDAERTMGLSNRESIDPNHVIVFVFEDPSVRCFWMKDMKFPIDIVWLGDSKRVNAIEYNVTPKSYPDQYCHVNAQYVAEFAEGTAKQLHLQPGDSFSF